MTKTRDEVLQRLVREGVLSAEQAMAVRDALDEAAPRPARARWAEVAGYVGGGLLLAGALSLVGTSWEDLTHTARIVILLATTAALLAAGIALAGTRPREQTATVRGRSGSVALALASGTAALAAGEIAGAHESMIAAVAGLVVAVGGYAVLPAVPGALACAGFAALAAGAVAGEITDGSALGVGVSLVATGVLWTALVLAGVIGQRRLGLGLGAAIALLGGQWGLGDADGTAWAYGLTFAVAVGCLVLYRWERAWVLLVAGVAGFTLSMPEAIWDWTDGAVGGSLVLMIAGAVLVASSVLGIRLHRASRSGTDG
ncbi:DUF2157 domain-containing protein [Nonomuraea basaltis]|uniref:DUF2157 domain-containing protein n=1 Tax=Nonomuraea basaltis TaxID=2495887 RepID=UPI001485E4F1|nr:DUF2157 domain-containing protein [Nonomuraea basaltis]